MLLKTSFLLTLAQLCWTAVGQTPRLSSPTIGRLVNKQYIKPARSSSYDDGPVLQYVELPVNHLGNDSETFMNRYWVDDYFYKIGGPVFFIDNGEDSAEGMDQYMREGASGSLAETFGGLLILWEHRFYGTSMPDITADMQFEPKQLGSYLKFLTIEQAMEDVAVFARDFSFPGLPGEDLTPGVTPWVFIGGSYSGARAAWMRIRNPDIFHASLSSSGVVELEEDFWEYYHVIETTMENTGWANCSADMRTVAAYLDEAFNDKNATAIDDFLGAITGPKNSPLYRYFHYDDLTSGSNAAWDNRMTNVRAAIHVMLQDFQYVGMGRYLGYFCDNLQAVASGSNFSPTAKNSTGIFADYNFKFALAAYAEALQTVWTDVLLPEDYPPPGATIANAGQFDCGNFQADCQTQVSDFAWMYQACSEFGAFQVTNSSRPSSLLPKIESVDNWVKDCISYFGESVADGPNLAPINKKYGGWDMSPSNVFFTTGEFDPWRSVSLYSTESGSPDRPSTTDAPASGETKGTTFFGYVIEGAFHCADLGNIVRQNKSTSTDPANPPEAKLTSIETNANTAHTLFINALNTWLPAFEKHSVSNSPTITSLDVANGGSNGTKNKGAAASNMVSISGVFYSMFVCLVAYSVL